MGRVQYRKLRGAVLAVMSGVLLLATVACGSSGTSSSSSKGSGTSTGSSTVAKWPTHTVTWIVTVGTKGSYYPMARVVAQQLSKIWGVPVVVESVPGSNGWNELYKAKPDGYTLGMGGVTGTFAEEVITKTPYDASKFTWLGRLDSATNVVGVSSKSKFTTLSALKSATSPVRVGAFSFNTPAVQGILLAQDMGFKSAIVSFSGPGPMLTGLIRGDIDLGVQGATSYLPYIKKGNIVPLIVWSDKPDPRFPGIKDLTDVGFPGLAALGNNRAVLAPPNMSAALQQKIIAGFEKAMATPQVQSYLKKGGFKNDPLWGSPFDKIISQIESAISKNASLLKKASSQI